MKSASEYAIDRIRQLAPPTGDARRAMMDERLSPLAATMTTPNDPMLAAYDNYWQGLTGQGEGSGWFGMNTIPQEMARLQGVSDEYGGLSPEYLQAFGDSALMPGPGVMGATKAGSVADALSGIADDLPMDEAARMARADELFPVDAYHATKYDVDEFVPSRWRGASFFSDTPEGASKGMSAGGMEHPALGGPTVENAERVGLNIMPVRLRGAILGRDPLPEGWLPENMTYGEWRTSVDDAFQWVPPNSDEWTQTQIGQAQYMRYQALRENYTEAVPASKFESYRDNESALPMRRTSEILPDSAVIGWESFEGTGRAADYRDLVRRMGFSGSLVKDESGRAIGMLDPANIRSRFAKFDPRNINSRNLLASGLGGLTGAGLLSNDAEAGQ